MRVQYLKAMHERAMRFIDMAEQADKRLDNARNYLADFDKANWLSIIRSINKREDLVDKVEHYKAVIDRLEKAHANVVRKIAAASIIKSEPKIVVSETY